MILGIPVLGLNPLWQFHLDDHLNWSLRICHNKVNLYHLDWSLRICYNKVNLSKGPKENDAKDDYHVTTGAYVSNQFMPQTWFLPWRFNLALCDLILFVVRLCLGCSDHTEVTILMSLGTLLLFFSVQLLQSTCLLIFLMTAWTNALVLVYLSAC